MKSKLKNFLEIHGMPLLLLVMMGTTWWLLVLAFNAGKLSGELFMGMFLFVPALEVMFVRFVLCKGLDD